MSPDPPLVVLDTNVLESAFRSRRGASFKVLSLVGTGAFEIAVSVPLVLEYEDVLLRDYELIGRSKSTVLNVIDYLCGVAKRQSIFFLWRPYLSDPKDDHLLELAIAAGCDAIVTHNQRHFRGIEQFGIDVTTPREFLGDIGET